MLREQSGRACLRQRLFELVCIEEDVCPQ
jgi:hypothetical protein